MTVLVHVADRILNQPLAITPDKLAVIASVLDGRINIDSSGISAFAGNPPARVGLSSSTGRAPGAKRYDVLGGGIARLKIHGTLVNRHGFLTTMSGLTSYEFIRLQLQDAVADPDVTSILLDLDSGGGEAAGSFETAAVIREARMIKPVVAVVDGTCCSAAFAIASAASTISATPTSVVGSIGVVALHLDRSRQMDKAGLTPSLVHAGQKKVDGSPYRPLTESSLADLQAMVDRYYELFIQCVTAGRPALTAKQVRDTEADVYLGQDALAIGLVDKIEMIRDVTARLAQMHPVAIAQGRKVQLFEQLTQEDLDAARSEGVRRGAAAALAGRSA